MQRFWSPPKKSVSVSIVFPSICHEVAKLFSWNPLPYCSPPGCPFPNKISCFVSTCVSADNSFPSVRPEPSFGLCKGSPFPQQMATLEGLFFTETDILITRGTQGPACLPTDQTQWLQLGLFCPRSPPYSDNWAECPNQLRNKRLY